MAAGADGHPDCVRRSGLRMREMRPPMRFLLPFMALSIPAVRAAEGVPVSYYKDVRPVLQTACHGCHQPAKAKGAYVMTEFAALVKGGEDDSGEAGSTIIISTDHMIQRQLEDKGSHLVRRPGIGWR